jgi:hypothetical protein
VLTNFGDIAWWYMEIPRTASTTIDRNLRASFPTASAIYQKHWPILPQAQRLLIGQSIVSIRNPYSRAVSCWQFFTKPGSISFLDWLKQRLRYGFTDIAIEARPQAFWFNLNADKWTHVLRQEYIENDFWTMMPHLGFTGKFQLQKFNEINGLWTNRCGYRTSRLQPWQNYYCIESRKLVLELYSEDFAALHRYYTTDFPDLYA